jgi:hypothetical protein
MGLAADLAADFLDLAAVASARGGMKEQHLDGWADIISRLGPFFATAGFLEIGRGFAGASNGSHSRVASAPHATMTWQ